MTSVMNQTFYLWFDELSFALNDLGDELDFFFFWLDEWSFALNDLGDESDFLFVIRSFALNDLRLCLSVAS